MTALPPTVRLPSPPLIPSHEGELKHKFTTFEKRHFHLNICFGAAFFLVTLSTIVLVSTCLCLNLPGVNTMVLLPGLIPGTVGLFVGLCLSSVVAWVFKRRNKVLAEVLELDKAILNDPTYDLANQTEDFIKSFIKDHLLLHKSTSGKTGFLQKIQKKLTQPKGALLTPLETKIQNSLKALEKDIPKEESDKETKKFDIYKRH